MKDDLLLIDDCKQGNSSAFELLYKKHAPKMKGVAYRYVGSKDIAEDILQEAFVKVYTHLNSFENIGSFESWLRRIVVNTAINYINNQKKENENLANYTLISEDEPTDMEELDYTLEELTEAINQLPRGYKLVFNMYIIDGYSHKDISETMNISEGTSKSQLYKAREYVKKALLQLKQIQHER